MVNPGQDGDLENDVAAKVECRKAVIAEIRMIEKARGFRTLNDDYRLQDVGVLGSGGVTPLAGGKKEGNAVRVQDVVDHEIDLEAQ